MIQFGLRFSYLKLLKNYMIATFMLLAQIGISKNHSFLLTFITFAQKKKHNEQRF